MRLSTKARYSLRILVQLAMEKGVTKALRGKDIAKKQCISEPYLEQIMIPLKAALLVSTIRGCRGGYSLNKDAEEITVLDIIELFEGKIQFVNCLEKDDGKKCGMYDRCPTTNVWAHLSDTLKNEAAKITLASIVQQVREQGQEYVI